MDLQRQLSYSLLYECKLHVIPSKLKFLSIILLSGLMVLHMNYVPRFGVNLGNYRHCVSLLQPTPSSLDPHLHSPLLVQSSGIVREKRKTIQWVVKSFCIWTDKCLDPWTDCSRYTPHVARQQNICDTCCMDILQALCWSCWQDLWQLGSGTRVCLKVLLLLVLHCYFLLEKRQIPELGYPRIWGRKKLRRWCGGKKGVHPKTLSCWRNDRYTHTSIFQNTLNSHKMGSFHCM